MANLTGTSDTDVLIGYDPVNTLRGMDGDDYLLGNMYLDPSYATTQVSNLFGGNGNDFLIAAYGGGELNGQDGDDQLVWDENNFRAAYGIDFFDPILPTFIAGYTGRGGLGIDLLFGGYGDDLLYGQQDDDTLYGAAGNDQLNGGDGNDSLFDGNSFGLNDILKYWKDDDLINGGNGDDLIITYKGNDIILGGAGNDTIYAERIFSDIATSADIDGGSGSDVIRMAQVSGYANGNIGNDLLVNSATQYGDYPITLPGDNVELRGGSGDDILITQTGHNVRLFGDSGNDQLTGADGFDDYLSGGTGDDVINAGSGNDTIFAGLGDDMVNGQDGNDIISLGEGTDTFDGGNGNDLYLARPVLGRQTVIEGAVAGEVDELSIAETQRANTINKNNILFGMSGNDLLVGFRFGSNTVANSTALIVLKDQLLAPTAEGTGVEKITLTADGNAYLNTAAINQLVQDMIAFGTINPGFDLSSLDNVAQNSYLQTLFANAFINPA